MNDPSIIVIAPWREWDLSSRKELVNFAQKYQIPIPKDKKGEPPFSTDANLLHTSSEGKVLEDPWIEAPEYVYSRTKSIIDSKDSPDEIIISFEKGDPIAINEIKYKPHELLTNLNKYGYEKRHIMEKAPSFLQN